MQWLQQVLLVGMHGILFDHPVEVRTSFMKILFFFATQLRKLIAPRKWGALILLCRLLLLIAAERSNSHFQGLRLSNLLNSLWCLLFLHREEKLTEKEVQARTDVWRVPLQEGQQICLLDIINVEEVGLKAPQEVLA